MAAVDMRHPSLTTAWRYGNFGGGGGVSSPTGVTESRVADFVLADRISALSLP